MARERLETLHPRMRGFLLKSAWHVDCNRRGRPHGAGRKVLSAMSHVVSSRFTLSLLADAWEYGAQARSLRRPCGMTGNLRSDRRILNESACKSMAAAMTEI